MSGLELLPTLVNAGGGSDDDDLEHYYCGCNEDIALCGADLSGIPELPQTEWNDDDLCIVCADLLLAECVRCGR